MKIASLPTYQPVQLKEPIVWERLVIEGPTTGIPKLDVLNPTVSFGEDFIMIEYTNPRTEQRRGLRIKMPAGRTLPVKE